MYKLNYINDFKEPRREARRIITEHLEGRGDLSFSYLALTLSSTLVCTLGLITNSTAVIIGGMIIAPLMWPLLKISFGISIRRPKKSYAPFMLLLVSTLTILLASALVAFITPYKQITPEILSRINPTSIEIFIAFAAAIIAALAVTHPKINDSVAGVAVATSLMPPLCASGIGLAYLDFSVTAGAFLLFLTNAVTILLVSVLIFTIFIYGKDLTSLKNKQILSMVVLLLIIAVPLTLRLMSSISDISINTSSKQIIEEHLEEIAPNSELDSFEVIVKGNEAVVRAKILLPPSRNITFEQEQALREDLSASIDKEVELQLVLQDSFTPLTEDDVNEAKNVQLIEKSLEEQLLAINPTLQISSINSALKEDNTWDVAAIVRASDQFVVSGTKISEIENTISRELGQPLKINLEVVESRLLSGETDGFKDITLPEILSAFLPQASLVSSDVNFGDDKQDVKIFLTIRVPSSINYTERTNALLKARIEKKLNRDISLETYIIKSELFN